MNREPVIRFRRQRSRFYRRGMTMMWGTRKAPHGPVLKGMPRLWVGLLISTRWGSCMILWLGR